MDRIKYLDNLLEKYTDIQWSLILEKGDSCVDEFNSIQKEIDGIYECLREDYQNRQKSI